MTANEAAIDALAGALESDEVTHMVRTCAGTTHDLAAAILATDWTPAERAALGAAIGGGPGCSCDFPAGACRDTHCRCYHHGYSPKPAPDLLEAARAVCEWYQGDRMDIHAPMRALRAAIAGAEA